MIWNVHGIYIYIYTCVTCGCIEQVLVPGNIKNISSDHLLIKLDSLIKT